MVLNKISIILCVSMIDVILYSELLWTRMCFLQKWSLYDEKDNDIFNNDYDDFLL